MHIMQQDILDEIFCHLHDSRFFTTFPIWRALLDRVLADNSRFLCGLALVCRAWVQAARRATLRHILLQISSRNAPVFLDLVQNHGRGLWVKTLILDFPFIHEQMSHDTILSFVGCVIGACPNITDLHLDNVPPSLAASPQLLSPINSTPITSFAMRCIGPHWSSPEIGIMPEVDINIPYLPRLRRLALWGCNINGIAVATQHPTFSDLCGIYLYLCHISDSFLCSLVNLPLRHLFIGKDAVEISTLHTLIESSSTLEKFEYHFLLVGDGLLSDERATVLALPDTVVRSCDHPLGYTFKGAERRTKIMRRRESGTFTDHCFALGFEIPISSAIDLSMRIGAAVNLAGSGDPLWRSLDELHNLEAYITSHATQRINIVRVYLPTPPPYPSTPFRLFACYQVVPLLGAQIVQDVLVPIEVDGRTERHVKRLLGCPESPTRQYLLQNVGHDFVAL